jgi:hypothetical protein
MQGATTYLRRDGQEEFSWSFGTEGSYFPNRLIIRIMHGIFKKVQIEKLANPGTYGIITI